MTYTDYDDPGQADWEAFMDECELAYEKCKCGTKSSGGKRPYSTKSLGIVQRAPETKTLSKGYEMKSNWNTKAGGGGAAEGPEIITKMATKAIKAIQSHVESLHDAADDIESLVDGKKSGRAFSSDNAQTLRDHAQNLHDLADDHEGVVKHLKKITTAADDLATRLQGSVPTYASPNAGVPASGQQEGSGKHSRGTYETKSSWGTKEAVITESSMADALRQLQGIRAQGRVPQETFVERQIKSAQQVVQVQQEQFQQQLSQARQESRKINW